MAGIYDWEFDGNIDFAPYDYRIEKHKKCKALGEKIKDKESALAYLKLFKYVNYLAKNHINKKCYKCLYNCKENGNLKLKKCRVEELRRE